MSAAGEPEGGWVGVRNRLRECRIAAHWTQEEVGQRVGVSRQTIISLESGRYQPSLKLAFRLAAAFGGRIEDLFIPEEADLR